MNAYAHTGRIALFVLVTGLALLLVSACTRSAVTIEPAVTPGLSLTPTQAPVGVKIGTAAPEFNLHNHIGEEVQLSALRGQAVVLYFWNTSCKSCMDEMTALQDLYTRYQSKGLVVLGINNKEQSMAVGDTVKNLNLSYPLLLDREGTIANLYRVTNFPATFFVDRNGIITEVRNKAMKAEEIDGFAQKIVASLATQPTVTPTTPTLEPITSVEGCVNADALNVRLGPGTDNEIARLLQNGACEQFDARNADSTWLRLASPAENPRQWVSAQYIDLKGEINALPPAE